jgi:hypothetical protein
MLLLHRVYLDGIAETVLAGAKEKLIPRLTMLLILLSYKIEKYIINSSQQASNNYPINYIGSYIYIVTINQTKYNKFSKAKGCKDTKQYIDIHRGLNI